MKHAQNLKAHVAHYEATLAAEQLAQRLEAVERRLTALGHTGMATQARTYAGFVRSNPAGYPTWEHWCGQLENAAKAGEHDRARLARKGLVAREYPAQPFVVIEEGES